MMQVTSVRPELNTPQRLESTLSPWARLSKKVASCYHSAVTQMKTEWKGLAESPTQRLIVLLVVYATVGHWFYRRMRIQFGNAPASPEQVKTATLLAMQTLGGQRSSYQDNPDLLKTQITSMTDRVKNALAEAKFPFDAEALREKLQSIYSQSIDEIKREILPLRFTKLRAQLIEGFEKFNRWDERGLMKPDQDGMRHSNLRVECHHAVDPLSWSLLHTDARLAVDELLKVPKLLLDLGTLTQLLPRDAPCFTESTG